MLNNSISESKKFNDLPDDTCRLLATWLISHLDKNGVYHGDPMIVRSKVLTRRADVSAEQVAIYLEAMQEAGLIVLFEARGEIWQWWPGFAEEQVGLRADRETTKYPQPPDAIQQPSGNLPATFRQSSGEMPAEEKLSEVKSKSREENALGACAPPPDTPGAPDTSEHPPPKLSPSQAMFSALAALCQVDIAVCTDEQRGALNQSEARLRKAKAAPDMLGVGVDDWHTFAHWWYWHDWRGKKGEPPKPHQVREEWGKFRSWQDDQVVELVQLPEQKAPTPDEELWQEILTDLQGRMTQATFDAHLRGSVPITRDENCLQVALKRPESVVWIDKRLYDPVVLPCLEHHEPGLSVKFVTNRPP